MNSAAFNSKVGYLESTDLNQGILRHPELDGKVVICMIQASWCPHCRNLKPVFQEVADKVASDRIKFTTAQVDGDRTTEKELASIMPKIYEKHLGKSFQGFPTIVCFKGGMITREYKGDRSVEDIVRFVQAS
jgi:thiol-disulfide isomerase/thioredoxin